MFGLLKLFGRSPFAPLQAHMKKVTDCVLLLPKLFEALDSGNPETLNSIVTKISKLEHAADLIKNDIRNKLPRRLLFSMDRGVFLEILSLQDSIADTAEDIAVLTTLKTLAIHPVFKESFEVFLKKNIFVFQKACEVISELDELVETSFGGIEAEKVSRMVDDIAFHEHESDLLQRELAKYLFSLDDQLSFGSFHLWLRIFEKVADIANLSETLGYRIQMSLELK